jgi:hypothetical protein
MTALHAPAAALAVFAATATPAGQPLLVRSSPALAPCAVAAATEYARATGSRPAVETAAIGRPQSVEGADVVVAADAELNRVIESGMTDPQQELDVASVPWVLAAPPGAQAPSADALGKGLHLVDVLGGAVARETWRRLARQGASPARVDRPGRAEGRETREPFQLQPGEAAVVPLSLAGTASVTALDVPPLRARALAVRASAHPEAARDFLRFLSSDSGNAAFRSCGRPKSR